ncbi:hypothetical protein PILCRDRAFT_16949 [Piloderma croceum F 1598]|uniref:Uncharacterized protein n=1 Tax=Piloderma croceum (strain F 1598) TaxID=765440 RepID=A0A0C3EUT5_PILCF|nr:hypothetical protein PILCRDRAFT_16949 [Piloderma croceum F 1598]
MSNKHIHSARVLMIPLIPNRLPLKLLTEFLAHLPLVGGGGGMLIIGIHSTEVWEFTPPVPHVSDTLICRSDHNSQTS